MDERYARTQRAAAAHFWFHGFRRFVTPLIDDLCGSRRDLRILDCGCGTGQTLPMLAARGRVLGLELYPAAAKTARAAGAPVVCADITRIPCASAAFDLAVCFDVLQCIEADLAAVREMARVVRPGGHLLLTVAALDMLAGDHAELWKEVRRYTPATARALAEHAGLMVERVSFAFAAVFPLMLIVRAAQRLIRPLRARPSHGDMAVPWGPFNVALMRLLDAEAALARHVPMPIGSSLIVVARRPETR